jgi:hypothetical protein
MDMIINSIKIFDNLKFKLMSELINIIFTFTYHYFYGFFAQNFICILFWLQLERTLAISESKFLLSFFFLLRLLNLSSPDWANQLKVSQNIKNHFISSFYQRWSLEQI